jgi:hypothetical protein
MLNYGRARWRLNLIVVGYLQAAAGSEPIAWLIFWGVMRPK